MRVLFDGCVPRRLASALGGHTVSHVHDRRWGNLDDSALLEAMSDHFDVLVTVDKSIPHQQNLKQRPFAVVVLRARSNRLTDLIPLAPALLALLAQVSPGEVRELTG